MALTPQERHCAISSVWKLSDEIFFTGGGVKFEQLNYMQLSSLSVASKHTSKSSVSGATFSLGEAKAMHEFVLQWGKTHKVYLILEIMWKNGKYVMITV